MARLRVRISSEVVELDLELSTGLSALIALVLRLYLGS